MWRCFAYLLLGPAYLAVASGVFLGASFIAPLILSSRADQIALAMIGTGVVLTASIRLIDLLDIDL